MSETSTETSSNQLPPRRNAEGDKNIKWLNQYTQQDLYFRPDAVTAAMDAVGDYLGDTVRGVK